jgi:hypothetical protein
MAVREMPDGRRDEQNPVPSRPLRTAGSGVGTSMLRRPVRPSHFRLKVVVTLLLLIVAFGLFSLGMVLLLAPPQTATITITPRSVAARQVVLLQAVSGAPSAPDQLHVQQLTATSAVRTAALFATGRVQQPARAAYGSVTFYNIAPYSQDVPSGSILTTVGGLQFQTTSDATVAAANGRYEGNTPVKALAMQVGASGNIAPGAISMNCCSNRRINGIYAINQSAFMGGQDAENYAAVQQHDIDQAAAPLVGQATQEGRNDLLAQVHADERLVASPTCTPGIKPSVPAQGRAVPHMKVTVAVTCSAESYRWSDALQRSTSLFALQEASALGSSYRLESPIVLAGTAGVVQGSKRGELFVTLPLRGLWVYQIDRAALARLLPRLAGKPWVQAQAMLQGLEGVSRVELRPIEDTLPSDAASIILSVETPRDRPA